MMTVEIMTTQLASEDLDALRRAVRALEGESFASRVANALGRQVQTMGRALPSVARKLVAAASERALTAAFRVAMRTINQKAPPRAEIGLHRTMAAASGAAGGAFGLAALAVELPISTTIMLRSIAQIARAEGEDLSRPGTALACLEVFALGGSNSGEAMLEGEYFVIRSALAKTVSDSARFIVNSGLASETAPILVRLVAQIAARFGVVVSEKLAAQAVPFIGAVGGAAVNLAFADHFQAMARGHFTVRRLERRYGEEAVRFEYDRLRHELAQRRRLDA